MQVDDRQYWTLISKGDINAYELAFKMYYQPLCNYAYSMLKNLDEAEDVVQNLLYIIWNKRNELQITDSLKAYLYRAVHNDCLNKLKHIKVRQLYAEEYNNYGSKNVDDASKSLQNKELVNLINSSIAALPEQCGIVFKLSRFENLKYSEIAQQLNISSKTVENHMGKALKILREKLKDYLPLIIILLNL